MVMAFINVFNLATITQFKAIIKTITYPRFRILSEDISTNKISMTKFSHQILLVNFSYVTIQTHKIYCIK